MNVDGRWKPVKNKRSLIVGTIVVLIMCGLLIYLAGIKGFLVMGLPVAFFYGWIDCKPLL